MTDQIDIRLRKTIVKALQSNIPPEAIKGENMIEELNISSVDSLEILVWVENEFGIMIDDSDLSQELIMSLDNLKAYVVSKLEGQTEGVN
jgi:acyl carrier protein